MNNIINYPTSSAQPAVHNRQQLDAVIENIVQMQLTRAELETSQEQEIAAIRQKYRAPLAELERYLTVEMQWTETWAAAHPGLFDDRRSLRCTHATVGYRTTPPRVDRASRRSTWSEIAEKLGEVTWGSRYLRNPAPEINKEALLSDRAALSPADLRACGLKITQEERFYLTPHAPESATDWQEAA